MSRRIQLLLLLGGAAVFGVYAVFFTQRSTLNTLATLAMYVALVGAWSVLGGYGGYLNLGMAAFFGVGAYTSALLSLSLGFAPWISLPAGALIAALIGAVIGLPTLRLRGPYFAIVTLLLTFVVQLTAMNTGFLRGAMGISVARPEMSQQGNLRLVFLVYFGLAVVVMVGMLLFHRSAFAHRLRAIREDEDGAEILGVNTVRAKMVAFLVGAAVAGAAGSVYAWRLGFVEPVDAFNLIVSINVVLMAVVGGSAVWYGALLGVPAILLIEDFLRTTAVSMELFGPTVPHEFNRAVLGALLIVMALFFRTGIAGMIDARKRRRAML